MPPKGPSAGSSSSAIEEMAPGSAEEACSLPPQAYTIAGSTQNAGKQGPAQPRFDETAFAFSDSFRETLIGLPHFVYPNKPKEVVTGMALCAALDSIKSERERLIQEAHRVVAQEHSRVDATLAKAQEEATSFKELYTAEAQKRVALEEELNETKASLRRAQEQDSLLAKLEKLSLSFEAAQRDKEIELQKELEVKTQRCEELESQNARLSQRVVDLEGRLKENEERLTQTPVSR